MATKKRVSKPSKKINNKSFKPLFVVIVLAFLGFIYYRAQIKLTPQPIDIMEVGQSTGLVSLNFASTDPQKVELNIDTENTKVSAAQIEISYDSKILGTPKLELGEFFSLKLIDFSTTNNLIKATLAVPVESGGKAGSGNALHITFPKKPVSETTLAITNSTMIAAPGYDSNVLKSTASLKISPQQPAIVNNEIPFTPTPAPEVVATNPQPVSKTPSKVNSPSKSATATTPTNTDMTAPSRKLTPTNFGNNAYPQDSSMEEYSDISTEDTESTKTSAFTKFLNWIKQILNAS